MSFVNNNIYIMPLFRMIPDFINAQQIWLQIDSNASSSAKEVRFYQLNMVIIQAVETILKTLGLPEGDVTSLSGGRFGTFDDAVFPHCGPCLKEMKNTLV